MAKTTSGSEASGDAVSPAKEKGGTGGRRITRNVRKARTLYEKDGEWQPSPEADFLMQEATVLALVDLAAAIREQNGDTA